MSNHHPTKLKEISAGSRRKDGGLYDVVREEVGGWIGVFPDDFTQYTARIKLKPQEAYLLLLLLNSARDEKRRGWITSDELMRRTGWKRSYLQKVKKKLRDMGLINPKPMSGAVRCRGIGDCETHDPREIAQAIRRGIEKVKKAEAVASEDPMVVTGADHMVVTGADHMGVNSATHPPLDPPERTPVSTGEDQPVH